MEDELYEIEDYANEIEFLGKAYAYQLYFNYIRKNRYRDNKSPVEILRERFPEIDEGVLNLPPIRLETLLKECYKEDKTGYDVPISVHLLRKNISNLSIVYAIIILYGDKTKNTNQTPFDSSAEAIA
ncbi:MAG: hypothetical protein NC908_04840 [Candidatus Omnitrophica bacterium]|nr:hypothetical protein [Candidatus Omnitrophota bacterium]